MKKKKYIKPEIIESLLVELEKETLQASVVVDENIEEVSTEGQEVVNIELTHEWE